MTVFRMPTRVHLRPGARRDLVDVLRELEVESVLVVMDPGVANCDWAGELLAGLRADFRVGLFDTLETNPRVRNAQDAAQRARELGAEALVAVGGGSAIDCAKGAAMLATNDPERALEYVGRSRYQHRPLPMVAIPTTCGTGSEVTWVSVLSDEAGARKISIKGEDMFPSHALVDADLLRTLPPPMVASTAMDALTHALEATTCNQANAVSDALASEAIALLFQFLPRAYQGITEDDEAREAVMRASTLAGLAFGNSDVAGVHCLSESLGGLFDVPHGLANATLLLPVMQSHRPWIDSRLAALSRSRDPAAAKLDDTEAAARFLSRVERLAATVDIPAFSTLGVDPAEFGKVAERAEANGSNDSNPRPMKAADYQSILEDLRA